jgi:hypothetical protein
MGLRDALSSRLKRKALANVEIDTKGIQHRDKFLMRPPQSSVLVGAA